jgi:hypothetical protein
MVLVLENDRGSGKQILIFFNIRLEACWVRVANHFYSEGTNDKYQENGMMNGQKHHIHPNNEGREKPAIGEIHGAK